MSPYNVLDAVLCNSFKFFYYCCMEYRDQTEADLAVESDREH